MRFLKWLAVLVLLVWLGGWYGGKVLLEKAAPDALNAARAQGLEVEITPPAVSGFPLRWELAGREVTLADPLRGLRWQGPELRLSAPVWAPWSLRADLPAEQLLTLPDQELTLTSTALQAGLRVGPSRDVPLRVVSASAENLSVQSNLGWQISFGEIDVTLREGVTPAGYDLTLDLAPLRPDPAFMQALAKVAVPEMPPSDLPAEVQQIDGDLGITLTAPLDRFARETQPQLQALDIRGLDIAWGALTLAAEGQLTADATGHAEGQIKLQMRGWERLPAVLVASGTLAPKTAPTVAGFLNAIASQSGEPGLLALTLVMKEGRMSLGPFPLGDAPRLR
ncbi:DUF2125 domain-containing protein [Xinfangfangia sp. CPCC 101601]|uniref:DUF2125 domain-containing protein n=1 Tax=Pseudogemmobacter lacusdianii TaxID=3069608 RepID=A0ABU0W0I5_9RHOB|nr:DUF2125 domain-containing protein [Xinfangfangia sp. CPCC 101601]MDQ2067403.1 DUF2125 domain-containing protein [Xinfangfangia sp. CPCC 101601]